MNTFCENKLVGDKIMIIVFLLFLSFKGNTQISYSTVCNSQDSWDNTYFGLTSSHTCSGSSLYDNIWSSVSYAWTSRNVGTSNGQEVTIQFDFKAKNYSGGGVTPTSYYDVDVWYYNNSSSSWDHVGTMSKHSSAGCETKTMTHTPLSGTAEYSLDVTWYSGDFYAIFDNISFTQISGPTISYASATYCSSDSDPSPTLTDNAGAGTYSSTSGLVFADVSSNSGSSTGVIDLSASTAGAYTITYTDTDSQTATFGVTITAAPDAGTLSGTSAICSDGSTTFSSNGDAGGTWTSGSTGVATINSSTGAISPVAGGTSTITYTVTGTGGCSDATSTRDVVVTAAPNAGTLSGTNAICSDGSTTFSSDGDSGGVWSSGDTGVATVNSSTGAITPVAGGTSTITYTVTGSGGCSNAASTRDVTISSDTYYVKPAASGGSDSNNGLTSGTAFATLQKAIDMVGCSSTTINVAAGTYTEEDIDISTYNISIIGAGVSTIFDGDGDGRLFTINASNTTISNMLIKEYGLTSGCSTSGRCGGGAIEIGNTSNTLTGISISGVTFTDNVTDGTSGDGGAIELQDNCTVTIENCIFNGNKAGSAASRETGRNGGALKLNSGASLTINNCLFYENRARQSGGAISTWGGDITINNSTIVDNTHYNTSDGAIHINSGTVTTNNSIIYNNYEGASLGYDIEGTSTTNYCIYRSTSSVTNNNTVSTSDPQFTDASSNDYTLQSSSPAVDAGSSSYAPATDILGVSRPKGSADDLGCYEYSPNTWVGGTSFNETNWTTASNWSNGTVPTSSESPIIANVTYQPEISSTVSLTGLTIDSGADITVSSNSLTVSGTFDLNGKMYVENATVNADGTFDATGGEIDFQNTNGKLILSSDVTSLGTLDTAMGTVEYDNSSACDILSDTYYNLELDGASVKTAVGNVTVNGDFTIQSACTRYRTGSYTTTVEGNSDINSELRINGASAIFDANGIFDATGGTVDMNNSGARLQLSSTVTSLGTLDELVGTVEYDGSTQNVLADAYNNLEIDQSGTKTSQGTITVASDLTVQSGSTFAIDATTITVTGTSDVNGTTTLSTGTYNADGASDIDGTLSITSTGAYNADGSFDATNGNVTFTGNGRLQCSSTVTNLGTLSSDNGTVEYDGSTQTVFGDNYYNLEIDVSGTKSAGGAINVDGNLSIAATAGCKLDMGAYALNIAGDLTVGATDGLDLTDGSSSLIFDGASDQGVTHAGSTPQPVSLLTENFSSGSIPEGNSSTYLSQDASNSSHSGSYGYWQQLTYDAHDNASCGGCSSYRATIASGSVNGGVSKLWVGSFTPSSTNVDVSFNWSFSDRTLYSDASDYLKIYLDPSVGSDVVMVNYTGSGDKASQSYSATETLVVGVEYVFTVEYANSKYDNGMYGASIDNISVTETPATGIDVNDLTINNSGGNIILNDEISLDGTITFTSGDIDASSNNLVLTSNASVSGADDDSHVVGTIVKTIASDASHEFPLGNGTVLRKVNIDPNDATSRDWTVTYTDNVYSDVTTTGLLTYVSDTCYWDITPTSTPASTTVKLNWTSAIGINDADLTNIKLAHYNGTDWELISTTTTGVPLAGSVSGNVTSFSPFTIGTTGANPLPVTLTQFEGYAYSDLDNKLEWTTKTEKNADYMEIQHSDDGKYFNSIGISKLAGNSQTDLFYEFIDRSVAKQINYYRLKQFDYDGKFNYSKIISIDNRHTEAKVVKYMTNLIGQKVDKNYKGVVIIYYTDGSSIKTIQ